MSNLYPLKFRPIMKEKIWGGSALKDVLSKDIPSDKTGESWELSGVKGDVSEIANGKFKNQSLKDLLDQFKGDLVGERVYKEFGNEFPLLIKFIDAQDDLSIQVHPNDDLAKERHNSFGKTEMWYVIHAEEGAELISGFSKELDKSAYLEAFEGGKLLDVLNTEKVKAGDVFFLPVGRVHAIKSGILLAEIQQTSDITYRIYDWDRVDDNGVGRELHTDLALDALDFKKYPSYKSKYENNLNERVLLEKSQYFETNLLELNSEKSFDYSDLDSFVIYMSMEGEAEIVVENDSYSLNKGETVLIPASIKNLKIKSNSYSKILEVYLPK